MFRTTFVIVALTCTPAFADDFLAIHMDNQKDASAVAGYWRSVRAPEQPKSYSIVHNDNQKMGSAVVEFWARYVAAPRFGATSTE